MEAMQDEDIGLASADCVHAEDLRRTLGYDKAQRNPLLVRMRKLFPAHMDGAGDDETNFYQAFIDLAENAETRAGLVSVLNELLRNRNGKLKFDYSLLIRLSDRMAERIKALSSKDYSSARNWSDLYRDGLILHRLESHGESVWAKVYRWVVRNGLAQLPDSNLPLAPAVQDMLCTGVEGKWHDGPAMTPDEVAAIDGDPLATWEESRTRLSDGIAALDVRPDAEAAYELLMTAVQLWKAAGTWADSGRLDMALQRLTETLGRAADMAGDAVAAAQAVLVGRQWSANDAERLETLTGQLDGRLHELSAARSASETAETAVLVACAEKRFCDLVELGPQAAMARQCLQAEQTALTDFLQTLVADQNVPDAGPSTTAASEQGAAHPQPPPDPQPQAATPATSIAPSPSGDSNVKSPFWAMDNKPLNAAVTEALKPTQPASAQAQTPETGQPLPCILDANDQASPAPDETTGFTPSPAIATAGTDAMPAATDAIVVPPAQNRSDDAEVTCTAEPAPASIEPSESVVSAIEPACVAAAIWKAVTDGRCGLAWHLAQAVPAALDVPPALFAALALAPCVRSAEDEASDWLGQQVALLLEDRGRERGVLSGEAADLLLLAVAARPMLLSPYLTDAQQLLLDAPALESLDGFRDLRRTLLDTPAHGVTLTPALLRGGYPQAQWNNEVQSLRDRATDWRHEAPTRNTNYHRATIAWKHWSGTGGEIARIVATLAQADPWPIETLRAFRERLRSSDTELERMLLEFDPRQAKYPIDGRARRKLLEYFDEVRDLLVQALELHEARPRDQGRMQVVDALRHRLCEQIDEAQRSLDAWLARAGGKNDGALPAEAVYQCVQRTLADLRALLGEGEGSNAAVAPWTALYGDLLLSADIVFADDWRPALAPGAATLIDLAGQAPDVAVALERRCDRGDLRVARRLLDLPPRPVQDAALLEERLTVLGEAHRRNARNRREKLCTRLELMLQQGVLGEQQYADAIQVLEHYVDSPTGDLRLWQQRFAAIEADIDGVLDRRRQELEKRLDAITEPGLRRCIECLLVDDDLLTAHEYLDHCERGEPLPQARQERLTLEAFFPGLVQAEARATQRPQREDVLARRPLGRVRLDELPDGRLDSSADLIDVWREMESGRRRAPGRLTPAYDPARPKLLLKRLFTALDFVDVEINPRTEAGAGAATTYFLRCRPLTDRAFCPVPQYGSQADGQYVLRCLEGGPEVGVDALLAQIRDLRSAAFALVFGWLDEGMRRELAQVCRTHRQTVLVIDEALIQALAGVAGDRRRALFEWTLPFTWLNPFSITASRVPPELFHGRQRALELVRNPREGFLVYGGRQLGKTALLTMTEHDCHRPPEERLALRIDLKSEGIGYGQGPGELWEVIARHLQGLGLGIIDNRIVQQAVGDGGKALRQRLQQWLDAKPHRQLLLMLDEADAFMLKDADADHPFAVLGSLKLLMEETDHRFKVVLAGLRDVQRMARIANVPNSPLAHLGRGICVGPLLTDGESLAARRLLEAPLRALGFRFESPELPNRILALANYYPSLIQVFGYHLIEHMTQRGGMLATPPYRIGSQHIDDTFRQASLRDEFVKRFRMTVALDPRYHLIALLIAQAEIDRRQAGVPESAGVDTAWVRTQALQWWPQGFARQDSFDDFCVLLGEMIGLGVLRVISSPVATQPSYTLRSPGIVQMLGGSERILHALDAISASEPPQLYDADVFHPYLVNETGPRSPLTGRQEERLFALRREAGQSVLALIGTTLAATPEHLHKLVARYDRHYRKAPGSIDSVDALCQWLATDESARQPVPAGSDGFPLAVIPATVPWTPAWLSDAAAGLQHRKLRTHLLFVGDEAAAWRWVMEDTGKRAELLRMLPWTPRAIRQWLQDCSHDLDEQEFARLLTLSGGWGRLLEGFGERLDGSRSRRPVDKAFTALSDEPLTKELDWPDPTIPATLGVLLTLADQDGLVSGISADLIAAELDPALAARVEPVFRWAGQLGLLERVSGTGNQSDWRLNSVLARLLGRQG